MGFISMLDFFIDYVAPVYFAVGFPLLGVAIGQIIYREWKFQKELQQMREKTEQQQNA